MTHNDVLISHPYALLAIMMLTPVVFIGLEKKTGWKLFDIFPPIIWIFVAPIVMSSLDVIPNEAPIYNNFKAFAVPMFIVLMLLDVDIRATIKIAFRSMGVVVLGSIGVVIGGMVAFFLLRNHLGPDAWRGFGALVGSWIGGTGNMAAVAEAVSTPPTLMGIVVLADTFIFILYFPLLFAAKRWGKSFARFARVSEEQSENTYKAVNDLKQKSKEVNFRDILALFGAGFLLIWIVEMIAAYMPVLPGIFTEKTWEILILTTSGLILATTRFRNVPGTSALSMALVYTYLSMIGAQADLAQAATAPYFMLAGIICMIVHLLLVVLGARLFKVDIHMAAIASVAAIGGAASAPVVAAYHRKELIPIAILLALVGYALGNYLGLVAAYGCRLMM
jgi:uncharacterized membrane protein